MSLRASASQTVGPFFSVGFAWLYRDTMDGPSVEGERIRISGRVLDGAGEPVPDAMLELWQANAHGKYAHPDDTQSLPVQADFSGFGRVATSPDGSFQFTTIRPGRVPGPDGRAQAPHIVVSVFARGLLARLVTRIYFAGDKANEEDAVLALVPADRRGTLMARPVGAVAGQLEWNVILQGPGETVFFEC